MGVNYSTEEMLKTALDVILHRSNYSTKGMLETTQDANYSIGGMLKTALDVNYSTGGMLKQLQMLMTLPERC